MDLLQSSKEQASGAATQLMGASNGLNDVGTVTKDTETTVAGNANAQSSADTAITNGQKVQQVIQSMCNNIHSVATEFEAMDNALSKELQPKYLF
ncbi:TIGR04197 family type VII secretion effector [Gemella sanguinis]|uniref:TIGR04197 family type VII secretion effector n=1 Tax=Gemella sanguinis TaxID=84135 RepID=UPI0014442E53|nr:TIGR04197 family type VII secretion effector [Gemella sanguinis]NKZ25350.1 TIGR04197 family type VII secretion effector [Gemella sanguinis]